MAAVLIATDPVPICALLGLDVDPGSITVQREVTFDAKNRPDLVLCVGQRRVTVIEAKVLSGLGKDQLIRYEQAEPNADGYFILHPKQLPVDTTTSPMWQSISWEALIAAHLHSTSSWVQQTAQAWLNHIDAIMPKVDETTRWNDLAEGESFPLAMRIRMSWLYSHLTPPPPLKHDLVQSSAGGSWITRLYAEASRPSYRVMLDLEEARGARGPKIVDEKLTPALGPMAKVVLLQHDVDTSAGFDWSYLHQMWPAMSEARADWMTRTASPKHPHDRAGYLAMVSDGAPKHLGFGFGHGQTKHTRECMFGSRIQFPPTITLGEMLGALDDLAHLLVTMSKI